MYTDRGIRKILAKYLEEAKLAQNLSPHKLRHFLLTWLNKQGIDDALIQPYSGHESRKSLEIYSKLAITDAQQEYNEVINKFHHLIYIYFALGDSYAGTTTNYVVTESTNHMFYIHTPFSSTYWVYYTHPGGST